METFGSADEILDFAIAREQDAFDFYTGWSKRTKSDAMRKFFEELASEERKHKEFLEQIKAGRELAPFESKIEDLKIAEFMVQSAPDEDLSYQDALILAMKREKASFKLYNYLADVADEAKLKDLFRKLAQEEAKHKLRLEIEYDDNIMPEN